MVIVILGKALLLALAISHGWGGAVWHVGYTVLARSVFGIWGSYIALAQRIVLCIVWYAVQSYTAGMCVSLILSSMSSGFNHLKNTLPESLPMDTKQFVGFIIYHVLSIPLLSVPPEKLKIPFRFISGISAITVLGTSIGSMVHAGGAGQLLHVSSSVPGGAALGMAWMHGINIIINANAVGIANQPDFSRFVRRPGQQVWGQVFALMILGTVIPLFGILGTSAASSSYGDVATLNLWNPPNIILQWLDEAYTPRSRCAAFFASFGFLVSTLGLNTIDNGLSGGMDLAGVWPKYINIRRGTYIIAIISIVIQPWQIVQNATVFVNVLGSYGLFLGPMIGVFTCDYFFVRKQKLKLWDLYHADSDSVYWFVAGFNWRAYVAWILGFIPGITGVASVNPAVTSVPSGAIKAFQISFIVGYPLAFIIHYALSYFFPPAGLGEIDVVDHFGTFSEEEAIKLGVEPKEGAEHDGGLRQRSGRKGDSSLSSEVDGELEKGSPKVAIY